jgi:acyl-CoA synthetase (AMP-forming)/AMP-acid ligase II
MERERERERERESEGEREREREREKESVSTRETLERLAPLISSLNVTLLLGVPTIISDAVMTWQVMTWQSIERVIIGGGSPPVSLCRSLSQRGVLPLLSWGMTELSPVGTVTMQGDVPGERERERELRERSRGERVREAEREREGVGEGEGEGEWKAYASTAGRPIPSLSLTLSEDGELLAQGPTVISRYLGEVTPSPKENQSKHPLSMEKPPSFPTSPESTQVAESSKEKHSNDPLSRENDPFSPISPLPPYLTPLGHFRTGDVALSDLRERGVLCISDRLKDVIKRGGEWISSLSLERSATSSHLIEVAAAVGVPSRRMGEEVCLVLVLSKDGREREREREREAEAEAEAEREVKRRLSLSHPRWQQPAVFVFLTELPLTSTGKIDKKRLRVEMAERVGELP